MSNEQTPQLGGHYSVLIDDESWTFPVPAFADTIVSGWGPGREGVFEQSFWSDEELAFWKARMNRHKATLKRWGWLRRGGRLGSRLASRLIAGRPAIGGSGLVTGNDGTFHVLEETFNCWFIKNGVVRG